MSLNELIILFQFAERGIRKFIFFFCPISNSEFKVKIVCFKYYLSEIVYLKLYDSFHKQNYTNKNYCTKL